MVENKRKNFAPEEEEQDEDVFSTVYGDLLSFIMFLFLMLYILTVAGGEGPSDAAKDALKKIKESLKNEQQVEQTVEQVEREIEQEKAEKYQKYILMLELEEYIRNEKLQGYVNIKDAGTRLMITLAQPVLFNSGEAKLKTKFIRILNKLGKIIKSIDNHVVIEGHTDNVPIHTEKFDSNWELSFARAYNVVKYLVRRHKIDPRRFSVLGYGEYQPKAPNNSRKNRAKNRRIEMSILFGNNGEADITEKISTRNIAGSAI